MQVREIMNTRLKTATADDLIKDISTLMCLNKISGVPVVEDGDRLIGVLSEKDILHCVFPDAHELFLNGERPNYERMEKEFRNVLNRKVGELMTKVVSTVSPEMPVMKAASMMWLKKIRRIPVVEEERLVGIVSIGDVHRALFQQHLVND
ncbi:MAG TPA: CBS domain-containing protein [Gammaproteobacteria bacterium]|nr:CBS domain-containing protein [Gammaproteobacteria bacterium]